ncbi:MAG: dihydrolipoamide acetyltransferase component of pyruvate dehydrogenase complex [Dehalococcoidia bacterium]|nr:MAG: dihydrolipoamide acetyltransferase component of pyruvate dehydrogenase complex [Dehalococcoidia bacterium]
MTTAISLPQLGESAVEGTIVRWLKRVGDPIARDEPLVEVMTDKVTVEIPSPVAGRIARLLAEEGETVPIGTLIAEIAVDAEAARTGDRFSPVVRKLAAEHGVDLALVPGSGEGGRVTKHDVLAFIARRSAAPAPAVNEALRRSIAEQMTRSYREIPTAWTMQEADVSGLVALRATVREACEQRTGVALSYLPFMLTAVVDGLRAVPALNSRWEDGRVVRSERMHLGIAVALDDGLIVPVVRDADRLSFVELARAVADLVARARAGRLAPDEVRGGTFTVNNTGAFGSVLSVPIVNAPQAGIVTMEAIVKRPVVVTGDAIEVRSIMNLCLSFDHRVLDGAAAGRFLSAVRARLEAYQPETDLVGGSDASTS